MPAFGDDVAAVVESLQLDEAVLIGHSMGGDVVVEAARKLPGRVTGLVWVDTYRTLGESRTSDQLEAFIAPFRRDFVTATRRLVHTFFVPSSDPDLVEWVASDMSSAPVDVAVDALEHAFTNDGAVVSGLRELDLTVVAINPDYRPTDVAALGAHGVGTVIMPGVGHFPMMEDPDAFNRLLGRTIEGMP
jgi:pimeloyl-ACP methyl ester carboxylesterase